MICACSHPPSPAPVVNAWLSPQARTADYIVREGDTIYSIAWQFGLDYSILARANYLKSPYRIYSGQHLKMTNVARGGSANLSKAAPRKKTAVNSAGVWQWPAVGKIVQSYSSALGGNPGINIAGQSGSVVRAALSGEVVYSGSGVRGYSNLIIIKHNIHYLSAYAYNQRLLVSVGQWVRSGQPIAVMGCDSAGVVMLHFEIRYDGQSVDPLHFLR